MEKSWSTPQDTMKQFKRKRRSQKVDDVQLPIQSVSFSLDWDDTAARSPFDASFPKKQRRSTADSQLNDSLQVRSS